MTSWFTPVWFLGSSLLSCDHWLRKLYFLCVHFTFNLWFFFFKTTIVVKYKPCIDSAKVSYLRHLFSWTKWIHVVSLLEPHYFLFWKAGFLKATFVFHKENFLDISDIQVQQHTNYWSFPKGDWNPNFSWLLWFIGKYALFISTGSRGCYSITCQAGGG